MRSWFSGRSVGDLADGCDSVPVVSATEYRRTGNDGGRTRSGGHTNRLRVFPTIDLDHRIDAAFHTHRPDAPDLRQHLGQEGLSAKAGIDRHHQDDIAKMQ